MRVNLPHCHKETTRHGATVYYFRKGKRPRVRLPDKPGTPTFMAAYTAALNGGQQVYIPKNTAPVQTLRWLATEWMRSSNWAAYKPASRAKRGQELKHILEAAGDEAFKDIQQSTVRAGIERRKATPSVAKNFLITLRALFSWAIEAGHAVDDPTAGLKVKMPKSDGHKVWGEAQMAAYEAKWPVGTRARLAYDVYAFTGFRRGDAVRFGRKHVKDGVATMVTEKTGTEVTLQLAPELLASIAATPHGETFISRIDGGAYTHHGLGFAFRGWCREAGLVGYSAHGLRKAAATAWAEAGLPEHTIMAMGGWKKATTAAIYTAKANRRKLGIEGSTKMHKVPHLPAP